MSNNCQICEREIFRESDMYCRLCYNLMKFCYESYTEAQLMDLYSRLVGIKIIAEVKESVEQRIKDTHV